MAEWQRIYARFCGRRLSMVIRVFETRQPSRESLCWQLTAGVGVLTERLSRSDLSVRCVDKRWGSNDTRLPDAGGRCCMVSREVFPRRRCRRMR